jgi:hypothetical protein
MQAGFHFIPKKICCGILSLHPFSLSPIRKVFFHFTIEDLREKVLLTQIIVIALDYTFNQRNE